MSDTPPGAAAHATPRLALPVIVLLLAAAARVPLLLVPPQTSDDVYRYLWEGRVLAAGHNPAREAPTSPTLTHLRDGTVWPRINHPEIATIYPPAAQALFLAAHVAGGTTVIWKALLLLLETGAGALLAWRIGGRTGVVTALLWLLHPILLVESGEAGHVEGAGTSFLLMGLCLWNRSAAGRAGFSGSLLIWMSVLVKPLAAPLLLLGFRTRGGGLGVLVGGVLAALSCLPFLAPVTTPAPPWAAAGQDAVVLGSAGAVPMPIPKPLVRSLDGEAGAHQGSGGLFVTAAPGTRTTQDPAPSATFTTILGRYAIVPLGGTAVTPLDFDGRDTVRTGDLGGASFGYYREGDTYVVFDPESGDKLAFLSLGVPPLELVGAVAPPFPGATLPGQAAVGFKIPESPLMGFRQFDVRWEGPWSMLHAPLEARLGGRRGVRIVGAVGALILVLVTLACRWSAPAAALALSAWTISLLPVIHPWYFAWILPGALLLGPGGRLVASLIGAAPLLHFLA